MIEALVDGRNKRVRKLLQRLHPAKTAALLEHLSPRQRLVLWQQIGGSLEQRVLGHLSPELRPAMLRESREDGEAAPARPEGEPEGASSELQAVRQALEAGKLKRVGKLLHRMHPAKVAGLLEALPPAERSQAWSMVETERAGRVLSFLHDEISTALAQELDLDDLIAAVHHLELDDLVDLIQALPAELGRHLVQATAGARREQLESMLAYPEDSAGGLMNADAIAVRADVKAGTVLRYLRLLETLPPQTDMLMVVDRKGRYQGALRLSALVTASLETRVAELMHTDIAGIAVDTDSREVARQFRIST